MCGYLFVSGRLPPEEDLRAATACLRHRGPDDEGILAEPGVFIGHTRLSIIDLTDAAHQPLASPDGRHVLAYNGEVYNYVELRERLAGWSWRSSGDTEVVLAGLVLEGPEFLAELRGMFSLVLYDRERGSILAARDQLGIKPLYYANGGGTVAFASEVRALARAGIARTIDQLAVRDFLLEGCVRTPRTIYTEAASLAPGSMITVEDGRLEQRSFWSLPTGEPTDDRSPGELAEELDERLRESVRIQLRSDVPVGTFLSGGLDSSLVTSYAAEQGGAVHTFSVGFEARDTERWDESGLARSISRQLGAEHHHVDVGRLEFERAIDRIVGGLDQPSVDGANTWFVSRATSEHVKVALSGQGGDELFAGYNVFPFVRRLEPLLERLPAASSRLAPLGWRFLGASGMRQSNWYLRALAAIAAGGHPAMVVDSTRVLFSAGELGLPPPTPEPPFAGDRVNEISRRLISGYLRDTLLRDTDSMSMQHSLEVRVPIVDHVLAEFALSIPGDRKVAWGNSKALLREIARRRLPPEVLEQPKRGFSFPLAEWLVEPSTLAIVKGALSPEAVRSAGLVAPELVARELRAIERGRSGSADWLRANRVWALFVIHEWVRRRGGAAEHADAPPAGAGVGA